MSFADFILQHEGDDPVRLLLSRDKLRDLHPDMDIDLAVTTLEVRRKLRTKVPEWYSVPSLVYPFRLSGEQCSSSETAKYKASLIERFIGEGVLPETCGHPRPFEGGAAPLLSPCGSWPISPSDTASAGRSDERREPARDSAPSPIKIADLTGGMGVDTWAFSQVAGEVLYNEMNEDLEKATELNFKELGIDNVRFGRRKVEVGKVKEVLDGFEADVIFLDPARRAEDGRKVFLIEECQPDVVGLLPELFVASRYVMLKLSPMADITMACKRLEHVKEVHVVASGGECKELLFLLDREWDGGYRLTACEHGHTLSWTPEEEAAAVPMFPASVISTEANRLYLFEPGKSLTKAGAFNLPCERFGMTKLGVHTHLYTSGTVPEELKPFGKWFEIVGIQLLNNRSMKEVGKRHPQAEVTARNIPMTSDLLRKKLGCASGGDVHIFGVRIDGSAGTANYLMETKRMDG